ncbi:stage II sporulation protein D [Sediminibacillus dalangtanensis]|uniref:Stage II sporulation protein D n=1 Tax=Sediminibacillus dalangtanensis TaxID=2729421 RepID=A0ABX7VYF9_9BACI|nr:stage II sporulation protein D [Sediminibacillus dalangtanensis]QTN00841.1 stage II sporulation protein D [Sediminibacillus dalangtanensis]
MKKAKQASTIKWRGPSMIVASSLIIIILVVPTLIVAPFIQAGGTAKQSIDKQPEAEQVSLKKEDSPFAVKVYRSNTEEVETVPLEEYVTHVVASEMPAEFELEALKAQALAARTYIVNHLTLDPDENPKGADVTDTVQHQVYKNEEELREIWSSDYTWKMKKIVEAVAETKGEIVTYENQPITPAFFSTSNGYTEDSENYWEGELPYLRSVASPWDKESPKYLDQQIFTTAEVEEALGIKIDNNAAAAAEIERTKSQRVASITIGGKSFSGREVREKLELRSSDFEVEQKKDHLIFTTKGYGHGIGMSQYGANGMAKEGKTYKQILQYYYKGADINKIDQTAPQLASNS